VARRENCHTQNYRNSGDFAIFGHHVLTVTDFHFNLPYILMAFYWLT